jgi:hypothetical protein
MKLIDIFLGSSIVELKEERQAFAEIIAELNTKLKLIGCVLYLNLCEQLSGQLNQKKSQELLDEAVRNSHYSYFIVRTKLGELTQHEFDIALEQFYQCGKPKLSVMFRRGCEEISEEAALFQERLKQIGYYYKEYQNKEEIKLNVVLNLAVDDILLKQQLSVEDGGIYLGDMLLVDTEQIPIYSKHLQLADLKKQLAAQEQQEQRAFNKRERRFIREKINVLVSQIREIENLIYETMLGLTKAGRGKMTPLLTRATAYLEHGDIEKAAEILNVQDVTAELDDYKSKTDMSLEGLQAAMETTYIAIETMLQMPESLERTRHIEQLFQQIVHLEVTYNLERIHCGLYVRYLLQRKKYDQAEKYILLYLEAPQCKIETLRGFIQAEYVLLGMHILLEPVYENDPARYQNLYIRTGFAYIQMYLDAMENLEHDQMNINPRMLGLHCEHLLAALEKWEGMKDDEIQAIEAAVRMQMPRLEKMGYRKISLEGRDGKKDAEQFIAQMELQAACEKLNEEPDTDDPREYLQQYAGQIKELIDFFETSNNMYAKNNPVIGQLKIDYEKIFSSLLDDDGRMVLLYAQIRISHAEHFVKVANFEIAVTDYRAAYNILKSSQPFDDILSHVLLVSACSGCATSLMYLKQYDEAESVLLEGIELCKIMISVNPQLDILLACIYGNYVRLCITGRVYDCIAKGLLHAQKAYQIFSLRRDILRDDDILAFSKLCTAYGELLMENGKNEEAHHRLLDTLDLMLGLDEMILVPNFEFLEHTVILAIMTAQQIGSTDLLRPKLEAIYGPEKTMAILDSAE